MKFTSSAIPVRVMQEVEHLIYRDFLHTDRGKCRGKWGHGWPSGAINQMLNRSNGNYCHIITLLGGFKRLKSDQVPIMLFQ